MRKPDPFSAALLRCGGPKRCRAQLSNAEAVALLRSALHCLGAEDLSDAAENGSGFRIVG